MKQFFNVKGQEIIKGNRSISWTSPAPAIDGYAWLDRHVLDLNDGMVYSVYNMQGNVILREHYIVDKYMVDNGYPDPGSYEYALYEVIDRKYKIMQKLFGPRKIQVISYGEVEPNHTTVVADLTKYLMTIKGTK